jgi:hypothetical protein
MANEDRKTRNFPERDHPDRNAHQKETKTVDEVISHAVHTAYQVAEENIRQGRLAAEKLRKGDFQTSDISDSAKTVTSRMMDLAKELSMVWVEMIAAIVRDPELRAFFDRTPQDAARQEPASAKSAAPLSVTYRVNSRKPTEVVLSPLTPLAHPVDPAVTGLLSLNRDAPAIHGVLFTIRPDGGLQVNIDIPDDQPSGSYAGTVVDRDSHQPIGTLGVRILE